MVYRRTTFSTVFLGWLLLIFTPLVAAPLGSSAWDEARWQEHCQGIRTSYNPDQDLSDQQLTLTPADARWQQFLSWIQENKLSEHRIESIAVNKDGTSIGVVMHWAPGSHWERYTTLPFGDATAYLVGGLNWQDTDFLEFFSQYGGSYGINIKDRLVLIDGESAAPWHDFVHFLTTLPAADTTLGQVHTVNAEQQSVTITAGPGKAAELPFESFAYLLGQVLTDCRAAEFFQAYDRQVPAEQESGKDRVFQEGATGEAEAESVQTSSVSRMSPIQRNAQSRTRSQGQILYERECGVCHGIQGDGNGPFAKVLFPPPRDFTRGLFRYRSTPTGQPPTDQDLYRAVFRGLAGTSMPAWGQFLHKEEIEQVNEYLKGFSKRFAYEKPPEVVIIPAVPPVTKERIVRGKKLYLNMGCPSCHGEDAKGHGSASTDLKTAEGDPAPLRDLTHKWGFRDGHTPEDVFRRLSTGMDGSPMPSYRGVVSDEELWDLVFYLLSLSPAERPVVTAQTSEEKKQ